MKILPVASFWRCFFRWCCRCQESLSVGPRKRCFIHGVVVARSNPSHCPKQSEWGLLGERIKGVGRKETSSGIQEREREREREREKRERKIPSFTIRSSSPRRKERKKRVKKIPPLPAGVLASKRDKRAGERERTRGSRGFCDARKSDAREFSRVTHISVGVMRQNTHEPFLQKKSWIVFDPSIHRNRQNGY